MQQQTVRAYRIKNEAETRAFALALADKLQAGDVLALIGELGTGKTALTRYIGEGLGIHQRISSRPLRSSRNIRTADCRSIISMFTASPTRTRCSTSARRILFR